MHSKTNLVLIGMPGSGKSTMGRWLAEAMDWDFLDTDDYMEETGTETVGEVIQRVGEDAFLDYERDIVLGIERKRTVISCGGSVPLRQEAMEHLRRTGWSILIDVPPTIIYERLERMKVDRIIGMNGAVKMTLEEILAYRQTFYDRSYDFRFSYTENLSKQDTFRIFMDFVRMLPIYPTLLHIPRS